MIVLVLIIVPTLTLTAKYICFATIATSSRMRVTGTLNSLSPSSYSILNEPSSLIRAEIEKKKEVIEIEIASRQDVIVTKSHLNEYYYD